MQEFWLDLLPEKGFRTATNRMATELLRYYSDLHAPINTKKHPDKWQSLLTEL
jgi:hypothetical protein